MRVISGKYGRRSLKAPKSQKTRPTTDKNKENLFNMLTPYIKEGIVLDLFGGSGGLGIEALSRGYQELYVCDHQYEAFKTIKANIETLDIKNAHLYKLDFHKALNTFLKEGIQFDLVLLDPPYGHGYAQEVVEFLLAHHMLAKDAIVVIEELKEIEFSFENLCCMKEKNYGITKLSIFKGEE